MWKRVFGGVVFVWMTAAAIGSWREVHLGQGARGGTELAAVVVCALLALIGRLMAIGPAKRATTARSTAGIDV
jgi:hypothetical protein